MIKMKRKMKGVIALGMTLAMGLAMVAPVWAAVTSSTTITPNETPQSYNGKAYVDDPGTQISTDVWVDEDTSYTISVPKRIVMTNIKRGESGTYTFTDAITAPYVEITEASLAPTQTLTVTVPQITLTTTASGSSATKYLTPKMCESINGTYSPTWTAATASSDSDLKITSAESKKAYINFNFDQPIYAGSWKGTMTFTAKASKVGVAPTTD